MLQLAIDLYQNKLLLHYHIMLCLISSTICTCMCMYFIQTTSHCFSKINSMQKTQRNMKFLVSAFLYSLHANIKLLKMFLWSIFVHLPQNLKRQVNALFRQQDTFKNKPKIIERMNSFYKSDSIATCAAALFNWGAKEYFKRFKKNNILSEREFLFQISSFSFSGNNFLNTTPFSHHFHHIEPYTFH